MREREREKNLDQPTFFIELNFVHPIKSSSSNMTLEKDVLQKHEETEDLKALLPNSDGAVKHSNHYKEGGRLWLLQSLRLLTSKA